MNAYEFYWRDPIKGYQKIGILPERRQTSDRITQESIIAWGTKYFNKNLDLNHIVYISVTFHGNPFRREDVKGLPL